MPAGEVGARAQSAKPYRLTAREPHRVNTDARAPDMRCAAQLLMQLLRAAQCSAACAGTLWHSSRYKTFVRSHVAPLTPT